MRLINCHTYGFESFVNEKTPPYLILSHRWEGAETTLQEFESAAQFLQAIQGDGKDLEQTSIATLPPGVRKVTKFCELARKVEVGYVWVDTCCIDKTSSAELQEAINSMYKWYELSRRCYVYLNDVDLGDSQPRYFRKRARNEKASRRRPKHLVDQIRASQWFTRGWTLQELLAPRNLVFVDSAWQIIDSRVELADLLEDVTGIRRLYFGKRDLIHKATVAERMSWLSERKTTREEDLAYCLLGIFDVNMTMLYGEGNKAFTRLQHEIISSINDETIFAWAAIHLSPSEIEGQADEAMEEAWSDCSDEPECETDGGSPTANEMAVDGDRDGDQGDNQIESKDSGGGDDNDDDDDDDDEDWVEDEEREAREWRRAYIPSERLSSILAPHPRCFATARKADIKIKVYCRREPYRMTNQGLEIEVYDRLLGRFLPELQLVLNCTARGGQQQQQQHVVVRLRRIGKRQWLRSVDRAINTLDAAEFRHPRDDQAEFDQVYAEAAAAAAGPKAMPVARGASRSAAAALQKKYSDEGRFKIYVS